ncbi:hypothetical protein M3484_17390 [Pseudomonas sp. GX19020]|uniref:hypothetical protein n=1 Tax=Pseudomonas sp. GX19020 TaxID=2942277 RepID=UPI002018CE8A|nr:hypothetical protein [Pseudomonas sp. GX19020]MCL4068343.1 hypothetical protein [Pseudomonas sp. GX19020]
MQSDFAIKTCLLSNANIGDLIVLRGPFGDNALAIVSGDPEGNEHDRHRRALFLDVSIRPDAPPAAHVYLEPVGQTVINFGRDWHMEPDFNWVTARLGNEDRVQAALAISGDRLFIPATTPSQFRDRAYINLVDFAETRFLEPEPMHSFIYGYRVYSSTVARDRGDAPIFVRPDRRQQPA